jgi:hypothetical protein
MSKVFAWFFTSISEAMFTISYQTPYNQCEWRTQSFPTLDEAERMLAFYISCGSPAKLIEQQRPNSQAVH